MSVIAPNRAARHEQKEEIDFRGWAAVEQLSLCLCPSDPLFSWCKERARKQLRVVTSAHPGDDGKASLPFSFSQHHLSIPLLLQDLSTLFCLAPFGTHRLSRYELAPHGLYPLSQSPRAKPPSSARVHPLTSLRQQASSSGFKPLVSSAARFDPSTSSHRVQRQASSWAQRATHHFPAVFPVQPRAAAQTRSAKRNRHLPR